MCKSNRRLKDICFTKIVGSRGYPSFNIFQSPTFEGGKIIMIGSELTSISNFNCVWGLNCTIFIYDKSFYRLQGKLLSQPKCWMFEHCLNEIMDCEKHVFRLTVCSEPKIIFYQKKDIQKKPFNDITLSIDKFFKFEKWLQIQLQIWLDFQIQLVF